MNALPRLLDLAARTEAAERERDEAALAGVEALRQVGEQRARAEAAEAESIEQARLVGAGTERIIALEAALAEATRLLRVFRDGEPRSEDCWAADRLLAKGGTT